MPNATEIRTNAADRRAERGLPDTRLQGLPLYAARLAWVGVALFIAVLAVLAAVQVLSVPIHTCPAVDCDNFDFRDSDIELMDSLGFPVESLRAGIVIGVLLQLAFAIVAVVVFWRGSGNWLAILTSFMLFGIGGLVMSAGLVTLNRVQPWSLQPANVVVSFVAHAFVVLLYVFPDGRLVPHWPRLLGGAWLTMVSLGIGVTLLNLASPAILAAISVLVAILLAGGFISQAYRYLRVSSQIQRQQTKWGVFGMLGVVIMLGVWGLTPVLFPPDEPGYPRLLFLLLAVPILLLLTLMLPVGVAFSILRYRLWDIDTFINRAVVYGLLTAGLVGGYFALAFGLSQAAIAVFGPAISGNPAVAGVAALVVAAMAQPLRGRLQNGIDRLIYRRRLIRARFLEEATELLSRAQPPRQVLALLEDRAAELLELEGAWLAAPEDLDRGDAAERARSLPDTPESLLARPGIEGADTIVIASHDERDLDSLGQVWPAEEVASWFAAGARVVVPLRRYGPAETDRQEPAADVRAAWVLGRRKDGGLFDSEDLDLFLRVGRQAAVVLDYARLHRDFDRANLLKRYLSPQVADSILAGDMEVDLVSSRKSLTVLFSDIRGFTAMSERMEPEELVDLLNEYLTAMTDIVFQHGGTLDKYIGDAVMVFVGDPIPYEDHEARALKIAFEMRARLDQLQRSWLASGDGEMTIGIGIATGYVTVGNIGSPARTDYTVPGNHVNLASRLADRADPGQILITERTLQAVNGLIDARQIDEVELRGVSRPIKIFDAGETIGST